VVERGDVWLVALDPTVGREIRKTRPAAVVSPNELNEALGTVIVAPMTTGAFEAPFRVSVRFQSRPGFLLLDQIRTIDRKRLVRKVGRLTGKTMAAALNVLQEMFSE
jgi:mRNA interferase MazF